MGEVGRDLSRSSVPTSLFNMDSASIGCAKQTFWRWRIIILQTILKKLRGRACATLDVILHSDLCICVTGKLSLCWLFHWAVQLQNEFNKCTHLCTNWKADAVFEMLRYTAWAYTSLLKKNKHKYDRFSCETANFIW